MWKASHSIWSAPWDKNLGTWPTCYEALQGWGGGGGSSFPSVHQGIRTSIGTPHARAPGANFYLTHPFFDLVSAQSSSWQTAHARVGGVQPLNLQEMDLFGSVFEAARRMPERVQAFTR